MNKYITGITLLILMTACTDQTTANQIANNNANNVQINIDNGKQDDLLEKIANKLEIPSDKNASVGNDVVNSPSLEELQKMPQEALKGYDVFLSGIPKPEETKTYLKTEIKSAIEKWTQRYELNKDQPSKIVEMFFDAVLIGSGNTELSKQMLQVIVAPPLGGNDEFIIESKLQILPLTKEVDVASYYSNVHLLPSGRIMYDDFNNRELTFVRSEPEYISGPPVIITNPSDLTPDNPQEEDKIRLQVVQEGVSLSALGVNVTVIYLDSKWKIDLKSTSDIYKFI